MLIRKAESSDFLELVKLLSQLTTVGSPAKISDEVLQNVSVAVLQDQIVGTVTLLVEDKIIHNGGKVGHVEDVVVDQKFRGLGIGRKLIEHAVEKARVAGCYKVILDCSCDKVGFYKKTGFRPAGVSMRKDL